MSDVPAPSAMSFLKTNREERFFCAVLLHALLTPSPSQQRLLRLMGRATETDLVPENLEVYVEVAALRDAWHALGDHHKYTAEVHQARLDALHGLLRTTSGFSGTTAALDGIVREHRFFWSTPAKKKLHSPGRWPLEAIQDLVELGGKQRLQGLKWAFNAKPDLLLISKGVGIMIEAKAASGFGGNKFTGYDQEVVQELIAAVFPIVAPDAVGQPLRRTTVTNVKHGSHGISWGELAEAVHPADIGSFAHAALHRAAEVLA